MLDKLCRAESGRILRRVPPPPTGGGETRYELFHDVLAEPILEWRRDYEQDRAPEARQSAAFARVGGSLAVLRRARSAAWGSGRSCSGSEARTATRSATSLALASAARRSVGDHVERSPPPRARGALDRARAPKRRARWSRRSRPPGARAPTAILRGGAAGVRTIAYSPDGRTLASADFDGTRAALGHEARATLGDPFRAHTDEVWGLAVQPRREDARLLELRRHRAALGCRGPATARRAHRPGCRSGLTSIAFSPDGRTVAVRRLRRHGAAAGRSSAGRMLPAACGVIGARCMSRRLRAQTGRRSPREARDDSVRLWDVDGQADRRRTLEGHDGQGRERRLQPGRPHARVRRTSQATSACGT